MKYTRHATAAFSLLTAVFFLTFGHITTAAPGDLDTSFFQTGKRTVQFEPAATADVGGVLVQPDGKIVVVGYTAQGEPAQSALFRLLENGSLDSTFGLDGKISTTVSGQLCRVSSATTYPGGKIIAVGRACGVLGSFAVARLNEEGTPDSTFGTNGGVVTPIGGNSGRAHSVAIQPDGKIVVAGTANVFVNFVFALARYNPDGSLDTTFDGDGMVVTSTATTTANSELKVSVAVQPDGKIVAAG